MISEQEKARLLQLHESALRAHFENDVSSFLAAYFGLAIIADPCRLSNGWSEQNRKSIDGVE